MSKVVVKNAKINQDFDLKVGLINKKLAYIGFATDDIFQFFPNSKIVETNISLDHNSDIWLWLTNFVNKVNQKINLLDFSLSGSKIEILVWKELLNLRYGEQITYSELAKRVGLPNAARYIAFCVARNPFLLLVPCHRVISKNGVVKYRSGSAKKLFLLENNF